MYVFLGFFIFFHSFPLPFPTGLFGFSAISNLYVGSPLLPDPVQPSLVQSSLRFDSFHAQTN
jgi:hypothetical protein